MRHVPGFDQGWRGYDVGCRLHYKETFMDP